MRKQDAALADVDGLVAQIHDLEGSSHRPSYSDEYTQLSKRRARLQKEERGLVEELAIWELADPKEALVKLKRRVETQSKELKAFC